MAQTTWRNQSPAGPRIRRGSASASVIVVLCSLVVAGCSPEPEAPATPAPAGSPESAADAERAAPEAAATEANDASAGDAARDCAVVDSRNWEAWIATGADGVRQLHVRGEVDLPDPGYTTAWREGPADRRMPPTQHLVLEVTPGEGMAAQVITPTTVEYAGPATYPEYHALLVRCGDETLAEISPIEAR